MKKYYVIMMGVILLCSGSMGCKRKGDVLATFKDGQITRGEFYEWLETRKFPKEEILKKKSQQSNKLKQYALDLLTIKEAKKAGYDKSEDFKYLLELAKRNYSTLYFMKKIRDNGTFNEEAVKVRLIKLLVKNRKVENNKSVKLSDAELDAEYQKRIGEAKSIIKELQSGKGFDDLAKKYSDDSSKNNGGDIGYITRDMRSPDFSNVAFGIKKGEYTKEPVKLDNGVYIIKIDDKLFLTDKNIEDVIKDKTQMNSMKRRLAMKGAKDFQDNLMKAKDVENHIDNIKTNNPNAVLFKVGEKEFKIADMNKFIDFISKKRGGKKADFDERSKRGIAEKIMREELLMREATKKGIEKEAEFKKEWEFFRDMNLAGLYKNDVVFSDIKVTPAEMMEEYNKNNERMKSMGNKGGKEAPMVMPFHKVKDRIEYMLLNRKMMAKRQQWESELLKNSDFKVNESELEGDDDSPKEKEKGKKNK